MPQREPAAGIDGDQSPRLSALAVVSMVCAAIPCCPVVNLAGAVLAAIAVRRIDRAGGRLRGGRLARVAFAVGVALALLSTLAWVQLALSQQRRNEQAMTVALERVVRAACDGDRAAVQSAWSRGAGGVPSSEEIAVFGRAVLERFGPLRRADVVSVDVAGGPLSTTIDGAFGLVFEQDRAVGSASFDAVVLPGSLTPQFRVRRLVIDDPPGDDLRLPASDDR